MTRAALYARFSTDRQDPLTIDDQLRQCEDYCNKKNMTVVATIADEAISGAASKTRPGVQRLLDLVRLNKIEAIVCTSQDRLTRDPELNEKLLKILPFHGVETHFTQRDGVMTPLESRLRSILSAEQLDDVRIKTWQGQRGHHLRGKAVAGIAYGYRVKIEHDARGDRVPGLRKIDPEEAEVVRRIFKLYSLGLSPRAIAKTLNEEGVPGPNGALWRDTTIRGHKKRGTGILHNETYIGLSVWNRQRYLKNPETEKRVSRVNDSAVHQTVEVPELRIVDQDLWDRVQVQQSLRTKVLEETAGNKLTGSKRPSYIFSGLIECGVCHGPYAIMGENRYGCTNHRKDRGCDNGRSVMRTELEHRVNSAIPDALLTPASIDDIRERIAKQYSTPAAKTGPTAKELRGRLRKVETEIANLLLAFKAGARSESMIAEMNQAEVAKKALAAEIEKIRTDDGVKSTVKVPVASSAILRIAAQALGDAARSNSGHEQALAWRSTARSMIEKVVVHPIGMRGVSLEVHGRLAVILAAAEAWNAEEMRERKGYLEEYQKLRQEGRLPTTAERLSFLEDMNAELERRKRSFERFQLTVVAGAGFEPATFRL
jgi:DNA invertase Pin-like site-specific DNA recombinase